MAAVILVWMAVLFVMLYVLAELQNGSGEFRVSGTLTFLLPFGWIAGMFVILLAVPKFYDKNARAEAEREAEMAGNPPPEFDFDSPLANVNFDPATVVVEQETRQQLKAHLDAYMRGQIDYQEMWRLSTEACQDSKDIYAASMTVCVMAIHMNSAVHPAPTTQQSTRGDANPYAAHEPADNTGRSSASYEDGVAALNRCRLFLDTDLPFWLQLERRLSLPSALSFLFSAAALLTCLWWFGVSWPLAGAWVLTALLTLFIFQHEDSRSIPRSLHGFEFLPFESEGMFSKSLSDCPNFQELTPHSGLRFQLRAARIPLTGKYLVIVLLWLALFPLMLCLFPWLTRRSAVESIHNVVPPAAESESDPATASQRNPVEA